jgi:3-oxoacyl-[acyl-carrier protein] reductase
LITGSSRGIGAATAKLFAANGAAVAVNYTYNKEAALSVVREIEDKGGRAIHVQADVTDHGQVERMVAQVETDLGPIDTLVLNAGLNFVKKPFLEMTWDEYEYKYVGEMKASFYCCKVLAPKMMERKKGNIIFVSSGLSRRSGMGFISHSASKSAINAFARSLATELSPMGIRINTVSPGLTLTDATRDMPVEHFAGAKKMVPLQRVGMPEDVAGAILLLASDVAGFITGGYLPVDGGVTML